MPAKQDLTGQTFGRWLVLRESSDCGNGSRKRVFWVCECQCEKKTVKPVEASSLKSGLSKSCGCLNSELTSERNRILKSPQVGDLTGSIFGRWTVIGKDTSNIPCPHWLVKCSCKKKSMRSVSQSALLAGRSRSCGCIKAEKLAKYIEETTKGSKRDIVAKRCLSDVELNLNLLDDCRAIPLTRGMLAIVDACDFDFLSRFNWFAQKPESEHTYYAVRSTLENGVRGTQSMHRVILERQGIDLTKWVVDHKDGNGLNNRRSNLRRATNQQNTSSRRKKYKEDRHTSKYKGVGWVSRRGKWRVRINVNRKEISGGFFTNEIEAANAYNVLALKFFGEFAVLNELPAHQS